MAIDIPTDLLPSQFEFAHLPSTRSSQGGDGMVKAEALDMTRWSATAVWRDLPIDKLSRLEALLVQLRGYSGRVNVWHFARPVPRLGIRGTPLVKGASQSGNTLLTDGWQSGIGDTITDLTGQPITDLAGSEIGQLVPAPAPALSAGDFFGLEGRIYMMTASASPNVWGEATLHIEPALASAPADNAPLTLTRPTVVMHPTMQTIDVGYEGSRLTDATLTLLEDPQ